MQPTLGQVHIDRALTNLAINYTPQEYKADRILPFFKVTKESDKIFNVLRERMSGHEGASPDGFNSIRSEDGTSKALGGFSLTTDSYSVDEFAYHDVVFDRVLRNQDAPLNIRGDVVEALKEALMRDREIRTQAIVQNAANYPAGHTEGPPATKWNNVAADLVTPIDNAKTAIRKALLGKLTPLYVLISWEVWLNVKENTDFKDRVKYVQTTLGTDLNPMLLARYWDVDEVIVGQAYYNSAAEGQTETLTPIWNDDVVVFHQERPSVRYRGLGMSFTTLGGGVQTRTWRDEPRKGEVIEVEMASDEKLVVSGAGYHITDVLP